MTLFMNNIRKLRKVMLLMLVLLIGWTANLSAEIQNYTKGGSNPESVLSPIYPPANGNTYYVGPDGDDSRTGSQAQNYSTPWRTIQRAASYVEPGEKIVVKDGEYTRSSSSVVTFYSGGVETNWIIVKSENLYGAKINGENNARTFGVNFETGANYIWLEGFEIYGCDIGGVWTNHNCHDLYFYKNKIHTICQDSVEDTYGRVGIFTKRTVQNVTIDGNVIHSIGRIPHQYFNAHDYKHDHGIYAQGFNIKVQNNIIYDCHAGWCIKVDGHDMDLDGSSHVITNNTFAVASNPIRGGFIRFYSNPVCEYWSKNVIIQNNIFHEPPGGVAITKSERDYSAIIRNNLMTCDSIIDENNPVNMEIYNNILSEEPEFEDVSNMNFRILDGSPCIDNAVGEYAPEYDIRMIERPEGSGYDIGAYENIDSGSYVTRTELAHELNVTQISRRNLTISYSIPDRERVSIAVYDILGRKSAVIVNEVKDAGNYTESVTGDFVPGIYFTLMRAGNYTTSRKFLCLTE